MRANRCTIQNVEMNSVLYQWLRPVDKLGSAAHVPVCMQYRTTNNTACSHNNVANTKYKGFYCEWHCWATSTNEQFTGCKSQLAAQLQAVSKMTFNPVNYVRLTQFWYVTRVHQ